MTKASRLVDEHINNAQDFAKPICRKIRELIIKADPQIIEDWKWGGPVYQKDGNVCGFGAFKQHVSLFFFKGSLLADPGKILTEGRDNLNSRSIKFRSVNEVNEKVLIKYIKEAVRLNTGGVKVVKPDLELPVQFLEVLSSNNLKNIFDNMPYTHRKEYVQYIRDAKKEETRERRLIKVVEMIRSYSKQVKR